MADRHPEEARETIGRDGSGGLRVTTQPLGAHIDAHDQLRVDGLVLGGLGGPGRHPVDQPIAVTLLPGALPDGSPLGTVEAVRHPQGKHRLVDPEDRDHRRNLTDGPLACAGLWGRLPAQTRPQDVEHRADGQQIGQQVRVALLQVRGPTGIARQQPRQVPDLLPYRYDRGQQHRERLVRVTGQAADRAAQSLQTQVLHRCLELLPGSRRLRHQGCPGVGQT